MGEVPYWGSATRFTVYLRCLAREGHREEPLDEFYAPMMAIG